MFTLFAVCAAVGGVILLFQLVMSLLGLAGEGGDVSGDAGHVELDASSDLAGDVAADHDVSGDLSGEHVVGHQSDFGAAWLFSVVSFRSVVAGLTFFGLAGLAADMRQLPLQWIWAIALVSGVVAMYLVGMLFNSLKLLGQDGTVRIQNARGKRGSVYVPVPGHQQGVGKVQLKMQDRLVEYQAVTQHEEKLATGASIEVVKVISADTVEVRLVAEKVETAPVA